MCGCGCGCECGCGCGCLSDARYHAQEVTLIASFTHCLIASLHSADRQVEIETEREVETEDAKEGDKGSEWASHCNWVRVGGMRGQGSGVGEGCRGGSMLQGRQVDGGASGGSAMRLIQRDACD